MDISLVIAGRDAVLGLLRLRAVLLGRRPVDNARFIAFGVIKTSP